MDPWFWLALVVVVCAGYAVIPFLQHILKREWDERRDRKIIRTQARKDFKGQITLFCDQWEDRDIIIPIAKSFRGSFRGDLVVSVRQIREELGLLRKELPLGAVNELLGLTEDFLQIAAKDPNATDEDWCRKHGGEIEEICKRIKDATDEF